MVLLRHGESSANADDAFGGWLDFPLTERGRNQAAVAGRLLRDACLTPDAAHTSVLSRAVDTAAIALSAAGAGELDVHHHWRLNERHYGALQGRARTEIRAEFGDELFAGWRRSYDLAPPPLSPDSPDHPRHDARYAEVPPRDLPSGESLSDVRRRLVPYWRDHITADLLTHRVTLVVAHGNTIRALCMHLDDLSGDEVRSLTIPIGTPLCYELNNALAPTIRGGRYLDPEAAARSIEADTVHHVG